MDWEAFQRRARDAIPQQELKSRRCWIGVLSHDKDPNDELEEADFIWMIGHGKISIQKVHETYQKRHEIDGFQLKFKDALVDQSDIVKSFLVPGEDLVLFLATMPPAVDSQPQPIGLQPSRRESDVQAEIATQTRDVADSFIAAPTTHAVASDGTNRTESPSIRAANTYRTPNREMHYLATVGTQNLAPPLNPVSAKVLNGTTPTQDRTPSWYSKQAPTEQAMQQQWREPSRRSSSRLSTPPGSVGRASHETSAIRSQHQRTPSSAGPSRTPSGLAAGTHEELPYGSMNSLPRVHGSYISPHGKLNGATNRIGIKAERQTTPPIEAPPLFESPSAEPGNTFDLDRVFNRGPSPQMDSQDEPASTDHFIREIIKLQDPNILEAGVATSLKILNSLSEGFSRYAASNADAKSWSQAIEKLIPQAERKRTVVGVVGNTGAGKSSVINAMLDEERLVPTNCMRACTAVVTEISWNNSTDPLSKYRAEIEFITKADWEKELYVIMKEFLTENGTLSREAFDPNSDAGVAWVKFNSVYPAIPKDALGDCTIASLMSKSSVVNILGTTKKIQKPRPQGFYQELQRYVDSKEKVSKKDKDKSKVQEKRTPFQMEYWPLIKVVKIYTKSSALSTGAVIVDLPGVHDSNAARAAVAQGYMKQCTGLWIVAPINRAVDDKAAKTLLGDSFKRQLKYDGGFSSVTFICSKTDDISITEAIDSLALDDEVAELEEQRAHFDEQIEQVESKISDLKESREVYRLAMSTAADDIEVWEGLQDQLDDGKSVFAPSPKSNKRKKTSSSKQSRKKRQDDDSDDDFLASDEDKSDSDNDVTFQSARVRLSESDIKDKLRELRDTKKNARREGMEIKLKMDELKPQISELQGKKNEIKAEVSRICIAGRNNYSKTAIQNDFAAGIKEIDQENAAEEDEDGFNPEEELRDYDQVAKSLPVFCVSSRAYQKMCGRMQKDDGVPGFVTPEETEVPQLQAHCRKLTEGGRIQTCRTFLTSLCQLLTTFNLWTSNDGTGLKMTDADKRKQIHYLKRRLGELTTGLEEAVRACIKEMRSEMRTQIFDKCPELIDEAIEAAPATVHAWGDKSMGGLMWASYKAVVRRDGVYQSTAAGHRDFNNDLVDPILKRLATGWERAFQTRLPKAFNTYVSNSGKIIHKFHEAVEERARDNGVGLANLSMLKTQIHNYEQAFRDLGILLVTQMTELQREANRDFTPTIANIMHTVYDNCTVERGAGQYKRMKEFMRDHVEYERHRMFHEAVRTVEKHLDAMCKALQESMEAKADEIFVQMNRDYMRVLGGVTADQPILVQSKEEAEMKSEIRALLKDVDAQFESIASGELVAPDVAENGAGIEAPLDGEDEDESGVFDDAQEFANHAADHAPVKPSVEQDGHEHDDGDGGPSTHANDDEMDEEL